MVIEAPVYRNGSDARVVLAEAARLVRPLDDGHTEIRAREAISSLTRAVPSAQFELRTDRVIDRVPTP
jgi:hypothetical protein